LLYAINGWRASNGGACDDAVSAGMAATVNPSGDRIQPGPTVLIGERNAAVHLLDVRGRVKPVAILKFPSHASGKQRSDG